MTLDELRALCLSLPGAEEKETWGDAEHQGDATFRVRDRIFAMTGPDGGPVSVRTTAEQQADLIAAFPDAVEPAAYVGRFGWVRIDTDRLDPDIVREVIESAWRRTAPRAVAKEWEETRR